MNMDCSTLRAKRSYLTGTAKCGPACLVVWEPGLAYRVSHRPPDGDLSILLSRLRSDFFQP